MAGEGATNGAVGGWQRGTLGKEEQDDDHDQLDDGHDDDYDDGWMDKRDKYLFGNIEKKASGIPFQWLNKDI